MLQRWKNKRRKKYSIEIYEADLYFYEYYKENVQVEKNGHEYILFRIYIYFTEEYLLAVEIEGKGRTDRDLIFE